MSTVKSHTSPLRPRRPLHSGFTLLELTVVMAVLGVVALAASSMLSSSRVLTGLNARQAAEELSASLRTARATAISSQQPISVWLAVDPQLGTGYHLTLASDPNVVLQPVRYFPPQVVVQWSSPAITFQPTGMSDRSLTATVVSPGSSWLLDIRSASGQVTLTKQP